MINSLTIWPFAQYLTEPIYASGWKNDYKVLKTTFVLSPVIYFIGAFLHSYVIFLRDLIYGLQFLLAGIYFVLKDSVSLSLLSSAYLFYVVFDLLYLFFFQDW